MVDWSRLSLRGNSSLVEQPAVGVAGSRRLDESSAGAARRIGDAIARSGFVLVSGDAVGADDLAQTAALSAGGSVVMVLPYGLERWRPRASYRRILTDTNHLVASEFAPTEEFTAPHAHQRNATIIGHSFAHVVVRADTQGGSWQGGLTALRSDHPLFVVERDGGSAPGNVELARRGAVPVRSVAALVSELQRLAHARSSVDSEPVSSVRPQVVNVRSAEFTVYIGRPSPYGNPFKIGPDGSRAVVIKKFRAYAIAAIADGTMDIAPLVGAVLGCHCKPADCHGDVLADLVVERFGYAPGS